MKITIGFSYHKGFAPISYLIRKYLGRSFSHTYIKLQLSEFDDCSVFHAIGKGLIHIANAKLNKDNVIVKEFELDISDDLYKEICNNFHSHAGSNYGVLQNLGVILYDLKMYPKNPFDDGINCSEWVAYCLEEIDPIAWNSNVIDFNSVKPDQIYDYLEGING